MYVKPFWYNTGCDRQTDGQSGTDWHDDSIYRASVATRGKNTSQVVKICRTILQQTQLKNKSRTE